MYSPINRILDTVVFFALDSMNVNKTAYIIVYDPNEEDTVKTRILVIKTFKHKGKEGIVDLDEGDVINMETIANQYLRSNNLTF